MLQVASVTLLPLAFDAKNDSVVFSERVVVGDYKLPYLADNVALKNILCNMPLPAVATTMLL